MWDEPKILAIYKNPDKRELFGESGRLIGCNRTKGLGVTMKKTLLIISVCFVLIAGYIVGQLQDQNSGRKSSAQYNNTAVQNNGDVSSPSLRSRVFDSLTGKDSGSQGGSLSLEEEGGCTYEECMVIKPAIVNPEPNQDPVIGNPKGSKIIKSGTVEITIKRGSVTEKYDDIVSLIPQGGYIEASESTRRTSTLTVRIPSEKLDETLVALRKLGTITKESIGSVDRTYDSIDYDARLKIMREREVVLNDLLKKATTAGETANIQAQIFQLRGEIESTQGLKSVLDEQVALSTLQVTISEDGVKKTDDKKESILGKSWTISVGAMLTSLSGIMIVFTSILPLLVVAAFGIYLLRRLRKNSNEPKQAGKDKE